MRPLKPIFSLALLLLVCRAPAAQAQESPGAAASAAPAAAPDAEQIFTTAEDLRLLEAINPLKLTTAQIDQFIPLLESAQARLQALDVEERRALAAMKPSLDQAREQALQGSASPPRLQDQLIEFEQTTARKRKAERMDLARAVAAKLARILSPAQASQITTLTQTMMLGNSSPFALAQGMAQGPSLGTDRFVEDMEKLRGSNGPKYELRRAKFVEQFMKGMSSKSPDYQNQLDALMKTVDGIHAMPPTEYDQRRNQLAISMARMRYAAQLRLQAREAAQQAASGGLQNSTGLEAFVDQVLMSPRAVAVLRDKRTRLVRSP